MSLVFEPCSSSANLVGRALATDPEKAAQVLELEWHGRVGKGSGRKVGIKRREKLEAGRIGRDGDLSRRDRSWKGGGEVGSVA